MITIITTLRPIVIGMLGRIPKDSIEKPQSENQRNRKDSQVLEPCQRTKKTVEYESDSDANCNLERRLEDLEMEERIDTIQTTALLRLAIIPRRVLETQRDLLSLRLQ